jgi:hypothetical protein
MTTMRAMFRRALPGMAVAITSALALAPAASAAISPTLTLDQSAGTAAGSTANLGLDLKFNPTGTDSPKDLTLVLPAGLLANASINGGACLKSATPTSACQVGTGTVTAKVIMLGTPTVPVSVAVTMDLVAPPASGDLAGLALIANGSQLGSTAAITARPSTDPAGFGLNLALTNLPDTYSGLSIAVDEIQSTLSGLRLPATCPATPAGFSATADSYGDSTKRTTSAPLKVTGCAALPYAPNFTVTAIKDSADTQVQLTTDITQTAAQAPSKVVSLAFPASVLAPNLGVVGALCSNPSSGTCTPIGSASSTSPLYPTPLVGKAYLTGAVLAPAITLVFPPPFALTLTGAVDLSSNSTTFSGLPDIPLTDLSVTLNGGKQAVFESPCTTASGTATATLTTQNGDRTASVPSPFTVAGCAAGAPSGATTTTPPVTSTKTTPGKGGAPRITAASLSGLASGKPALFFQLVAGSGAAKLSSFTVELPRGLAFVRHRVHKRLTFIGLTVAGAKVRSVVLTHGHLVVTLRQPASSLIVSIAAKGLSETAGLKRQAQHGQIKSLKLFVITKDAAHKSVTLTLLINSSHKK